MSPRKCFPALLLAICMSAFLPSSLLAADLPSPVQIALQESPLQKVGTGTYRKFGFRIYDATLWAPGGNWNAAKPYALEMRYARSLSKDTIVDSVMDSIRDQDVADEATLARWQKLLEEKMPAIEDGDRLTGLAIPGKESQLFYNDVKIASITDPAFSKAFFDIWFGKDADEDLRADLLGQKQ